MVSTSKYHVTRGESCHRVWCGSIVGKQMVNCFLYRLISIKSDFNCFTQRLHKAFSFIALGVVRIGVFYGDSSSCRKIFEILAVERGTIVSFVFKGVSKVVVLHQEIWRGCSG